ncbi:hypothetical protein VP511E551_P0091 [Vibrio phage 511E55-1]|nr:hypothetical protein VP511E551_P0091 [Vibrio phage 511E55-1]
MTRCVISYHIDLYAFLITDDTLCNLDDTNIQA